MERSEGVGTMGEGGGGTDDETQGGGGGMQNRKNKGERGAGWRWGTLCSVLLGVAVGKARNTRQSTQTLSSRVIVTSLALTSSPWAVAPRCNACSG
jgi:hypothetical protein